MQTKNSKRIEEAEIRTTLDGWANALRSKDVDGVISHYVTDVVQFLLAPPLQYAGTDSLNKKGLEEWFSSFEGAIDYEIRDLKITTSDDVAYCHSINHMGGTKKGGEKTDIWLRQTTCLCKINGKWKITHEHESVPFYMDGSAKAAIDLKP